MFSNHAVKAPVIVNPIQQSVELPKPELLSLYQQAEHYGKAKVIKSAWQSFGLAAFAGAFIALAFVFYITVTTGSDGAWGLVRLAGGLAFSLGLMLVVICGGELFTSTVLSSVAWAQKLVTTIDLIKCWGRVYLGNLIGAVIMLILIMSARMHELDGGLWGLNALQIAQHKLHHSWGQAFVLGVLCNMLVCLGVWMTFSSRDALTKAILLMLPVAMFVSSGFEHSIANLFMVPLGITIHQFADPAWFEALNISRDSFADLTLSNFIFNNLIPVTLGNIVGGGVFVGLGYWLIEKSDQSLKTSLVHSTPQLETSAQIHQIPTSGVLIKMPKIIKKLSVKDLMDPTPLTISSELSVYAALSLLADNECRSAPVLDENKRLLGFISQQDLLRSLWSEEFARGVSCKVSDLMQTEVMTLSPQDSVAELIELMVVDRSKLFPVNEYGILTGNTFKSYEERLRRASPNKPSVFPVLDNGLLCGVITREAIAKRVCEVYRV
ncbi:formate/nitrite transporter [Shewanella halifaxensis HAW-EB4]|uniref:Formate transporter FocA n=1 Tax=Shewanella halifaxensis (strain HAW-EB4) TaxID=458817 RepID=B0TKC7_SHEHH|nr:formate transporter FocA [Shewanella halifaxensis]ABZ77146.1 formate/nitrite transporter [Shewanella halifaxensis HAW-EB4]